jgi:crotonobetainyl-CoA:carnitine CoA-transferase CaiB-like acyl-CoA transferase
MKMTEMTISDRSPRPLAGVRVLEMGQLLAGPLAATLLAYFGAEVIKVEPPGAGDQMRRARKLYRGTSLWWLSLGRNKKCVTLDLRDARGQEIARRLAAKVDVLVENFKPGTLERWGLGYEELKRANPKLILARVSGYGQTGPRSGRPGYANVCEGFGGMRYVTGYPDRPPARANLSLGDSLAGLHAALGVLLALYHRDAQKTGEGQVVDVAIYESVFNVMESLVPEYDKLGHVRERLGTKIDGLAPSGTYPCADGQHVVIGANGDAIYRRLMTAAGREDLAHDPRLARNDGRVEHEAEIDRAIEEWTSRHTFAEVLAALERADVPAGPIYSAADIARDPHYAAREMFEDADIGEGETVKLPAFAPKLSATPGRTEWPGPPLGAHNEEVYCGMLGLSPEEIAGLKSSGVI